ncbi:MAG TPA: substrate-binding domain-containing protein [Acidobacteriaceae bacterium]|jgi:quinoprotein dehydrogenase-associated probable ABC transporter substrate-binding protein|nr:substrate-binding domain-containing protein [Acidobacteriaceae bacterium]
MSSVSKFAALITLAFLATAYASAATLRVCADPNNMPFSNRAEQGFENQLANLIAKDLGMTVQYYWFPQRSSFFKKTLNAGHCDIVMGLPSGMDDADTSIPYYRSSYVFVSRRDRHLNIKSMDDPRLHHLRIGVHTTGDGEGSLPPVNALISRGIVHNLVGFNIYGRLDEKNPPADLIRAVENNKVDIAIAWGPMAGYFARHSPVPLQVTPVDVVSPDPKIPFTFAISMGVRRGDSQLLQRLNSEIQQHRPRIHRLLESYGVPLLAAPPSAAAIAIPESQLLRNCCKRGTDL